MRWRLLTHEALTLSLSELDGAWSIDDVIEAHTVLDEIEAAQARMKESARRG